MRVDEIHSILREGIEQTLLNLANLMRNGCDNVLTDDMYGKLASPLSSALTSSSKVTQEYMRLKSEIKRIQELKNKKLEKRIQQEAMARFGDIKQESAESIFKIQRKQAWIEGATWMHQEMGDKE